MLASFYCVAIGCADGGEGVSLRRRKRQMCNLIPLITMISKEIYKMVNNQINAEIWSSYLYLSMSLYAETQGYSGVSNWFYVQSKEEMDHARILEKYLMAQEQKVKLLPISEVPTEWASPLAMFRMAMEQEKTVTKRIDEIMHSAQLERDYATCSMLSWFVDEQVEEEEQCANLIQQFEKASDSPCYFMQIDFELQKRQYEPSTTKSKKWYS